MRFLARCIGFAAGLTVAAALLSTTQAVAANEKTDKPKTAPPFDPSLYVGSETCKTCHEDIYKSFEATPHWKTTLLHRNGA